MSSMTRRSFLKTSARGLAIAAVPVIFKANPLAALSSPLLNPDNPSEYYEHFGVSEEILRKVMEAALNRGGDYTPRVWQTRNIAAGSLSAISINNNP